MSLFRRCGLLACIAASMQACILFSSFDHLDDGEDAGVSQAQAPTSASSGTTAGAGGQHGGAGGTGDGARGGVGASGGAATGGAGGIGGVGGVPMCKPGQAPCDMKLECCGELVCQTTFSSPSQKVCCGLALEPCFDTTDGKDCCGSLQCKTTVSSPTPICCGGAGDPCSDTMTGTDCCGTLNCGSNHVCG